MRRPGIRGYVFVAVTFTALLGLSRLVLPTTQARARKPADPEAALRNNASKLLADGQRIFRYDTFGDEDFWSGSLRLNEVVATLTPRQALALGLKVDSEALAPNIVEKLKHGQVNLDDPATTLMLLRSNAVLGVTGSFDAQGLKTIGIQCAFCHSTVDDSVAPGVGRRLDGWANRDLNVGAIMASAPGLAYIANLLGISEESTRDVLVHWGPGKFDAQLLLDGKGFRPDGTSAATLIPPAFGLAGMNQHTWTGSWGSVPYWNAFVANLEMRGKGVFFDPRLDDATQYPVAAAHPELFGHKRDAVDLISSKLPALHYYQLTIPAPYPPEGSFSAEAAARGGALFAGKAKCSTCHVEGTYSEPGWNLHTGADVCIDDFQANRAPDHRYRTSPLAGLWTHQKGGFFHDGRFATLFDVVNHYNQCFTLGLTEPEKGELVEYLKSLPN